VQALLPRQKSPRAELKTIGTADVVNATTMLPQQCRFE